MMLSNNKFSLGVLLATPGAELALLNSGEDGLTYLERHGQGDWGDLCDEDKSLNNASLDGSGRLMSSYTLHSGEVIWIITEQDRSATTILLPSEY